MGFTQPQRDWLDQFTGWAMPRNDVRAAMVFGSRSIKNNHQIDEWSDLDIAIFTSRPNLYTKSNSWMQNISSMWAGLIDPNEVWSGAVAASGFSVYKGGVIVDSIIIPTRRVQFVITCAQLFKLRPSLWQQRDNYVVNLCTEMVEFFRRGTIVLFDKSNLIKKLESISQTFPQYFPSPPSAERFQKNFNDFWVDPPRIVANLRRGQLVWAIRSFNPMMRQLFEMAEWHACAKQDRHIETEYRLKLIEKWADPRMIETLPTIYPQYSIEETWNALLELIKLYRQLAEETSKMLGYNCDFTAADSVSAWVKECYQKR